VRFLLDESADARIRVHLQSLGHDVIGIAREYPAGLADSDVLPIAYRTNRILITRDRDFGELVFVEGQPHAGVIFLRLGSSPPLSTITARLDAVFSEHAQELDRFLVVTQHMVRVRR
jgi:predicted nuclease of predicted toxin-antitoxin system